jgi:RNA polymerase sigma factor (sigma-70 family)
VKDSNQSEPGPDRREAVVLEHQALVRWQISRLVFDSQVVDDLAQEVFVAWFQLASSSGKPSSNANIDSPRGWLMRVARNKAIDWLRKNSRQAVSTGNMDGIVEMTSTEGIADGASNEAIADGEVRMNALRHCLDLLQPDHREIVEEFYRQGKSSELIAVRIGRGSSGVRMMLTRIRRALGKCIRRQLEKKK